MALSVTHNHKNTLRRSCSELQSQWQTCCNFILGFLPTRCNDVSGILSELKAYSIHVNILMAERHIPERLYVAGKSKPEAKQHCESEIVICVSLKEDDFLQHSPCWHWRKYLQAGFSDLNCFVPFKPDGSITFIFVSCINLQVYLKEHSVIMWVNIIALLVQRHT